VKREALKGLMGDAAKASPYSSPYSKAGLNDTE